MTLTYKHKFVLKGGMLISSMLGIDTRTTMDMDATMKGQALSIADIAAILDDILMVHIGDGAVFSVQGIEEIRAEADYPGYRVSLNAIFDKTRQVLKIDITTGDPVTPREIEYAYKLMFENRSISIMAYNLETILAEKFETIITRGVTNTRMRDFYDVYLLTNTHAYDRAIFKSALSRTAEKRQTTHQISLAGDDILSVITGSAAMAELWGKYQKKYFYASDIPWAAVTNAVKSLAGNAIGS